MGLVGRLERLVGLFREDHALARIYLRGLVTGELDEEGYDGSDYQITPRYISSTVNEALEDGAEGIIFDINSPGGEVVAGAKISEAIPEIPVPTIALIDGMAASAAYRIAVSCDVVIAHPLSSVGSIGVILGHVDASELAEWLGVRWDGIKSAEFKDAGSNFRPFTDKERKFLQKQVNSLHQEFVEYIAEKRELPKKKVNKYAHGETYLGVEAEKLGLVDGLGGIHEAIETLEHILDIKHTRLEEYLPVEPSLTRNLFDFLPKKIGSGIGSGLVKQLYKHLSAKRMGPK